jgi:hypothetical protein
MGTLDKFVLAWNYRYPQISKSWRVTLGKSQYALQLSTRYTQVNLHEEYQQIAKQHGRLGYQQAQSVHDR